MRYSLNTLIALSFLFLMGCNNFLDTLPDDRITVKDENGVAKLLTNAYPKSNYIFTTTLLSDNVTEIAENKNWATHFEEEIFNWMDPTEDNNDSPADFWQDSWKSIYTANEALDMLSGFNKSDFKEALIAEAKICRAYNEFMLLNVFSQSYNKKYAKSDLGIPYLYKPIKDIKTKKERLSVDECYIAIEKDINEALPHINDNIYKVPKYHFNKKGAYAFAARFYLFAQKWKESVECCNVVLEDNPLSFCRDWKKLSKSNADWDLRTLDYVDKDNKTNLMFLNAYSDLGVWWGYNKLHSRYLHSPFIASSQTCFSDGAWGKMDLSKLNFKPSQLVEPFTKVMYPKFPKQMEYIDVVEGTGYRRTTFPAFTGDEVLLTRAESYIHLEQYVEALRDMNLWLVNFTNNYPKLSEDAILQWFNNTPYSTLTNPTPKQHFNADFEIKDVKQEAYLQVCLHMRRIQTLQEGLRWFDIKRFGIECQRYIMHHGRELEPTNNVLKVRDARRALQLPLEVISAGMVPNPRN